MSITDIGVAAVKLLNPERAHGVTIKLLKRGLGVPGKILPVETGLGVTLPKSGLKLRSPIGLAAGFDKNCDVPDAMAKYGFGFVECGTVTPQPQVGNSKPRLFRLTQDGAVINRMGFNNEGLAPFVEGLKAYRGAVPIGANVGANKTTTDQKVDYVAGISAVAPYCDYITINISSPNTPGLRGLQNKAALDELLVACGDTERAGRPVFLKVAPDLDDEAIKDICGVVRGAGKWLSGLIISNTTIARPESLISKHKGETGGLSGAPLMAPSTEVLKKFARELKGEFDLIGAGGVASGADAYAKIKAGANAVQLYSALVYHGPGLVQVILKDLAACMAQDGVSSLAEAVGKDL